MQLKILDQLTQQIKKLVIRQMEAQGISKYSQTQSAQRQ
jgi:hypothetical protein